MTLEKLSPQDGQSLDLKAENIAKLKQLFPEILSEKGIDFGVLKQLLGEEIEESEERFSFNWNGKAKVRRLAQTPSTGTLRPCKEESKDWDSTKNLFIEGDNLEVLKLLQKSYHQKVKMIYIDPPYNTGKDFIYPDDFRDNIKNYLELTGQTDEAGKRLSANAETSGRYHTNWLNMMYPRLKLARNLLRDDGVIFISIDDTEVSNLRKLCDEIFGEDNFLGNVVWQKKYAVSNDDPGIGVMHDHILVFRKSDMFNRGLLPRSDENNARYTNLDNDPKGDWASGEYVSSKTKEERPTLWYSIKHPKTGDDVWPEEHAVWRYSEEKHIEIEAEGRLYWGPNQSYKKPRLKRYLSEVQDGIVPPTWWKFDDCGHNDEAQKETANLIGQRIFSTPKPTRLISRMLTIANSDDGIVLDFFSGSASTAHTVMLQNAKSNLKRNFILIQLPEICDETSEAFKNGFKNIADIGKERIRRAGAKILADNTDKIGIDNLDVGFKVFKLDSSNIKPWDADFDTLSDDLLSADEVIKSERSADDVLFEILLKYGLDLSLPIATHTLAGKTVFEVGTGALLVCLDRDITEAVAEAIGKLKAELAPAVCRVVFRDAGFSDDAAKVNAVQVLKQFGIDDVKSL